MRLSIFSYVFLAVQVSFSVTCIFIGIVCMCVIYWFVFSYLFVEFFIYSGYQSFVMCAAIVFPQSVVVLFYFCPLYPLMWFCHMQMLK